MRFSALHILLLGSALAAPISEVEDVQKRTTSLDFHSHGLFTLLPRVLVKPPTVPKPGAPKPVAPHEPAAPGSPKDSPGGLRPGSAHPAPGGGDNPPPPLSPVDPAPVNPADPAPVSPQEPAPAKPAEPEPVPANPDEPAPAKPDEQPPKDPNEPAKPNPDEPEEPPAGKPDDKTPVNGKDEPDVLPDGPACTIGGGVGKRATTPCVPAPPRLEVSPDSVWAKNGVEDMRQEGHQAVNELDQYIAKGEPDIGFKGRDNTPIDQKTDNVFNEGNMYSATTDLDPMMAPDGAYLQGKTGFDMSDMGQWAESSLGNTRQQEAAFNQWVKETKAQLISAGYSKKEVRKFMSDEVGEGLNPVLLSSHESPMQGSQIITMSDSRKADLYRPYTYKFKGIDIQRPAFGNEPNPAWWSDQAMAAWRASVRQFPGADVKNLRWMARDNIVTEKTQRTFEGVFEQMGKKTTDLTAPETITVRRTGGTVQEGAGFDAVSATVHGKGPIRMARDHHQELGDIKVQAYHITATPPTQPGGKMRYDMIIEFSP